MRRLTLRSVALNRRVEFQCAALDRLRIVIVEKTFDNLVGLPSDDLVRSH